MGLFGERVLDLIRREGHDWIHKSNGKVSRITDSSLENVSFTSSCS